jgi:hypothetical protein
MSYATGLHTIATGKEMGWSAMMTLPERTEGVGGNVERGGGRAYEATAGA